MLQVFAVASNALVVQSQRLHEIAAAVASTGATERKAPDTPDGPPPVRIGSLPVGDPIESMVSLKEVELAYKMNAAVIRTADEMLGTLLDAVDSRKD
jgi:flagellar basal-body rod protein FlgC